MSDDIFEHMFDTAGALDNVNTDTGKSLANIVRQIEILDREIKDATKHLKGLTDEKHRLETEQGQQLMAEMGQTDWTYNGVKVVVETKIHASIPVARREEAFSYVRSIGEDDMIKNVVSMEFGKGEDNIAGDVVGKLEEMGFYPSRKTFVHPSTLKARILKRMKDGKNTDLDLLGAYTFQKLTTKEKA